MKEEERRSLAEFLNELTEPGNEEKFDEFIRYLFNDIYISLKGFYPDMSDLDLSQLVCQEISDLLNSIDGGFMWEVESYFESMEDHYEAFKNHDEE